MKCCRVHVYLSGRTDNDVYSTKVAMTYEPVLEVNELIRHGYEWIWFLTDSMPLYPGYRLVESLKKEVVTWEGLGFKCLNGRWRKSFIHRLKGEYWLKDWGIDLLLVKEPTLLTDWLGKTVRVNELVTNDLHRQIAALLRGRNLYFHEICQCLQEMGFAGCTDFQVSQILIYLLSNGNVEIVPANLPDKKVCLRCGNTYLEESQCGICGSQTWYCPECVKMGESISCRPLFRRADQAHLASEEIGDYHPHYAFELSIYQAGLSKRLMRALEKSEKRDWLLWAVCGAGKTETTFGLIGAVLSRGGRVLFTSPRREVVRQMVERFKIAFPNVQLIGLYGGSEEKLSQAQLTIATVHQLVRFYQAFDLVIFDEVDAYPYKGDLRLQRLLQRSRKKNGKLVYLSATPDKTLLQKANIGELQILTLPARYHRKGVPVPEIVQLKLPTDPVIEKMSTKVRQWIEEAVLKELAQLYIFLPTRRMVETFGASLQKNYVNNTECLDWAEFTHSQDEKRAKKVEGFLRGDFPILVTTTIMERGVTVPKGNVLVLYADNKIFDCQSLIQMAGRAGRSILAPYGKVWFVGQDISTSMREAKGWIEKMNKEAKERGLLDDEISE